MKPLIVSILNELEATRRETLEIIEGLSRDEMESSTPGEWTIAQVIEHLYRVELGSVKVVRHLLKSLPKQPPPYPDDETAIVTMKFSQPEGAQAPEVVNPGEDVSAAEALSRLEEIRKSTRETIALLSEFDPRILKFPHPFLGDLNSLEWFAFLPEHEKAHHKQLREIVENLK